MSSSNDVPSPCAATGRGGTAPKPILKKPSGYAPGAQTGTPLAAASAKGRVGKGIGIRNGNGNGIVGMGAGMGGGAGGRRQGGPRSAEEARAIAVHHAQVLESRKQLELSILASVEHLLEYPTGTTTAERDGAGLKRHLAHFRPADLDDLVEERNIARKCGYPLCARPNALQPTPTGAKYRVLRGGGGASTPIVVETRRLERFCGDDCARRALWVRVQLSEQPAWLRPAGSAGHGIITLLEEERKREPMAGRLSDPAFRANLGKLADELRHIGISNTGLAVPNPSSSSSSSSSPSHKAESELQQQQEEEEEENNLAERLQRGAISETDVALQYAAVAPVAGELVAIAERPPLSVGAAEPPNTNAEGASTAALAVEGYTPQGPNKDLASRWKQVVTSGKQKHVAFDEKITA